MKAISVSNSRKKVLIDDEDYKRVSKYTWYLNARYIVHTFNHSDKVKLHHFILGRPLPPYQIDHINRNTFDNRKSNLRIVTSLINNRNRNLDGFGVKRTSTKKKWFAQIERNKEVIYLGVFKRKKDGLKAVQDYDAARI